jgi:metal iron transporter
MPHTTYLTSGLVQLRLRDFNIRHSRYHEAMTSDSPFAIKLYLPSISAIKSCMNSSIAELCITLFTIAIFINSAILIVVACFLPGEAHDVDLLFGMYHLFVTSISQAAGTMFALALLFSGVSAGIVATVANQLVAEGTINRRMRPFYRWLLTRSIAIVPGIIVAAANGRSGLAAALNGCNVVLRVALIFLTFTLILYTTFRKYMEVELQARVSEVAIDSIEQRCGEGRTERIDVEFGK